MKEYLYNFYLSGKEYNEGRLEYEGDYLYYTKWNGKGYDENGNITYVLKNGSGKIKDYNDDGNLIYEGEYLDGKKNGKGKEYDDNNQLIFYGEYLNGERWNGIGKEINDDDSDDNKLFNAEYINGKKYPIKKSVF